MGIADTGLYVDVRKDYSPSSSFSGLINALVMATQSGARPIFFDLIIRRSYRPPPFSSQISLLATQTPGLYGFCSACSGIHSLLLCQLSTWPS